MKPKVGRNFTSERGEGVKGEVTNISLHWLQGIFETVPNVLRGFLGGCQGQALGGSRTNTSHSRQSVMLGCQNGCAQ